MDQNQPAIVDALREAGFAVCSLHTVGKVLDLLVSKDGVTMLIECKMKGEKLTPKEKEFTDTWKGEWRVAYSPEQAVSLAIEVYRSWERLPF